MKIISLVPSWTETLVRSGISPVGRTRFCIHPLPNVSAIPVVGGTKNVSWEKALLLKPDLVIMDKEENTLSMAQNCPVPLIATHVTDWLTMIDGLRLINENLPSKNLNSLIDRAEDLRKAPQLQWDPNNIPGFKAWIQKPPTILQKVSYLIWKNPWMVIQPKTFIADMLTRLGAEILTLSEDKYLEVSMDQIKESLLLFSSEPFPFLQQIDELKKEGLHGALIDGEPFSWYGIRAIEFLEQQQP
ncbi:MAG: hypothetical protein RJB66_1941 [Pseudomonadota bacterium]|jgi:hypothetical protein